MRRQDQRTVEDRANGRCEYCQLPRQLTRAPFQIDHVIARQHGGKTAPDNLALTCFHCNLHKGPNIAGIDPASGDLTRLYHPRADRWAEHFRWAGPTLVGLTSVGRTTVAVLAINDPEFVRVREALIAEGVFPPDER